MFLGIDLGTSNSCVYAVAAPAAPAELVMSDVGGHLTPSAVAYTSGSEVLVGEAAKQQQGVNPLNTFVEFKRIIGRTYDQRQLWASAKHWPFKLLRPTAEEETEAPRYAAMYAGDVLRLTATDLCTVLLTHLVALATAQCRSGPPRQVVVTVPAHFDHAQRLSTVKAVARAVPDDCQIEALNEPTAAIIAYLDLNAADLVSKAIKEAKVVACHELGMEAIHELRVEDMPVTVAVDSRGQSIHATGPAQWRRELEPA